MSNTKNVRAGLDALLTPDNSVLILIDHQPFQFAGVRSHDTQSVINNVVGLAKSAKIFGVPTLLTTVVQVITQARAEYEAKYARRKTAEAPEGEAAPETTPELASAASVQTPEQAVPAPA